MQQTEYKLIYNDCLKAMKEFTDNSIDHSITSPPYNINRRIHSGKWTVRNVNEYSKYGKKYHDALTIDEYFEWQTKVIKELLRISKGYVFYNIQMVTGNKPAIFRILGEFADYVKEVLIWDKLCAEPAIAPKVLNSEFEFIFCFAKDNAISRQFKLSEFERGTESNIIRIGKNSSKANNNHSASFPCDLPRKLLQVFTKENDLILDCFAGVGTTGVACVLENRQFIGIDNDQEYIEIAKQNIEDAIHREPLFHNMISN